MATSRFNFWELKTPCWFCSFLVELLSFRNNIMNEIEGSNLMILYSQVPWFFWNWHFESRLLRERNIELTEFLDNTNITILLSVVCYSLRFKGVIYENIIANLSSRMTSTWRDEATAHRLHDLNINVLKLEADMSSVRCCLHITRTYLENSHLYFIQ